VCPSCNGAMQFITLDKLWVCVDPCGFQTRLGSSEEWAMLHSLQVQYRAMAKCARAFEAVVPESNIIQELSCFMAAEDI
jgi:hypothetical protein